MIGVYKMMTSRVGLIARLTDVNLFFKLATEHAGEMCGFAPAMLMRQEPHGPDCYDHAIGG